VKFVSKKSKNNVDTLLRIQVKKGSLLEPGEINKTGIEEIMLLRLGPF